MFLQVLTPSQLVGRWRLAIAFHKDILVLDIETGLVLIRWNTPGCLQLIGN